MRIFQLCEIVPAPNLTFFPFAKVTQTIFIRSSHTHSSTLFRGFFFIPNKIKAPTEYFDFSERLRESFPFTFYCGHLSHSDVLFAKSLPRLLTRLLLMYFTRRKRWPSCSIKHFQSEMSDSELAIFSFTLCKTSCVIGSCIMQHIYRLPRVVF